MEKEFGAAETGLQKSGICPVRPVSETAARHSPAKIPRNCGLFRERRENPEKPRVVGGGRSPAEPVSDFASEKVRRTACPKFTGARELSREFGL